ncbi:MAG: AAA family ATPase [Candidatus Sumerlaeota bacterium]|nr:AAA family ATPase [Candidatus Sumerlaeota bacterium]
MVSESLGSLLAMDGRSQDKRSVLAGREGECHQAVAAALSVRRGGAQALLFAGPRGIGKSALLEEIARRIEGLMPDAVLCRGRFGAGAAEAVLSEWAARLAALTLGQRISSTEKPPPLEALSALAARRGEPALRRLVDEARSAAQQGRGAALAGTLVALSHAASGRQRRMTLFLADGLDALAETGRDALHALADAAARGAAPLIATALPGFRLAPPGGLAAATGFRTVALAPLDPPAAAQVVERLTAERGRAVAGAAARALGGCLQGHGALTDSFARELAFVDTPELRLETLARALLGALERGAFAEALSEEFQSLFRNVRERAEALRALCLLNAEWSESPALPVEESPLLREKAAPLRAMGLLDWRTDAVEPTPFWALRQLAIAWGDRIADGRNAALSRFWRGAEVARRIRESSAAGDLELDAARLAACLEALSGLTLDPRHFAALPELLAPAGRITLPRAVVAEPLRFGRPWLAAAGMLGLASLEERAEALGETAFWVVAALAPAIVVHDEDVRQVKRLADRSALEAAGLDSARVWLIGGSFRPEAVKAAKEEGVALSTWSAWRTLNALPQLTAEQVEAEAPTAFDPSGKSFSLDLTGRPESETSAADAAETLAEQGGFAPDPCRQIGEAVRLACRAALRKTAGTRAAARVRVRLDKERLTFIVEHETARWGEEPAGGYGAVDEASADLAKIQTLVDEALTERLAWGERLTLRKRFDPFAQFEAK